MASALCAAKGLYSSRRLARAGARVPEVFVTGGGGFLAVHLVRELARRGNRVTVLFHHTPSAAERAAYPAGARIRRGDLVKGARPLIPENCEVIFHLAGRVSAVQGAKDPSGYFAVNAMGTARLLEEARERSLKLRRFVLPSTALVYGQPSRKQVREDDPTVPRNPYASSKLAAETYALACDALFDIPVTVLRLFNVYGPGQRKDYVIPSILHQCLYSDSLHIGNPWPVRDFLYVDDAVRLFLKAARAPAGRNQVFNVASGEGIRIEALARRASRVTGARLVPRVVRTRARSHDVDRLVADVTKARRMLGWRPKVGLDEGLLLTAASLKEK